MAATGQQLPCRSARPSTPPDAAALLPGSCCSLPAPPPPRSRPLQGLMEETAQEVVAGNQLVAVLRQLQSMAKRCGGGCDGPLKGRLERRDES